VPSVEGVLQTARFAPALANVQQAEIEVRSEDPLSIVHSLDYSFVTNCSAELYPTETKLPRTVSERCDTTSTSSGHVTNGKAGSSVTKDSTR
jgi:hypothetical protein